VAELSLSRLKERLNTLLRQKELAAQKAKMLEEQAVRDRKREEMMVQVVEQLMERQRELNVMLNRANIMLGRSHEVNMALSLEFSELVHALPAPEDPEVKERIKRINDLFRNTGAEDAEITTPTSKTEPTGDASFHSAGPKSEPIVVPPSQDDVPASYEPKPQQAKATQDEPPIEVTVEVITEGPVSQAPPTIRETPRSLDELFKRTGTENEETLEPQEATPTTATPIKDTPFVRAETVPAPELQPTNGRSRRWWQIAGKR
jgi:hypothetical protein